LISNCGALFFSKSTKRYLFLLRAGKRYANTWGLVGGKIEAGETVINALHREIGEELGFAPAIERVIPIETFTSDNLEFCYHTFVCSVADEFLPKLNHEHRGYCWTELDYYPKPLHPKVWNTFSFDEIKNKIKLLEKTFQV
jgi:8-oxo-dGTP pyrophosphatase MutT (NUDIX family)